MRRFIGAVHPYDWSSAWVDQPSFGRCKAQSLVYSGLFASQLVRTLGCLSHCACWNGHCPENRREKAIGHLLQRNRTFHPAR